GRRPILIASLLAGTVIYAAHAYATTPLLLIAARFAAGLASGSFAVAFAVASDVSTPAARTKTMGIVSAGFSLGFIFGPAIGGLTAGADPGPDAFARVCYVGAALTFIAAVATYFLLPETRRAADPSAAPAPDAMSLLRRPDFLAPTLIGFVAIAAMSMMESVFVLFADAVLELGPLGIGLVFSVMGATGAVLQAGMAGRIAGRYGERVMLILSLVALSAGLVLLGGSTAVIPAVFACIVISVGFSLHNPAVAGLASFAAPAAAQGVALGLVQAASSLGRVVGPAAAGPIYDGQGPTAPFYWAAVILVATIAAVIAWRPKEPSRPQPPSAAHTEPS
ncbi:MAG: MFS transporter, partial [Pseudomonadota bacterium]